MIEFWIGGCGVCVNNGSAVGFEVVDGEGWENVSWEVLFEGLSETFKDVLEMLGEIYIRKCRIKENA